MRASYVLAALAAATFFSGALMAQEKSFLDRPMGGEPPAVIIKPAPQAEVPELNRRPAQSVPQVPAAPSAPSAGLLDQNDEINSLRSEIEQAKREAAEARRLANEAAENSRREADAAKAKADAAQRAADEAAARAQRSTEEALRLRAERDRANQELSARAAAEIAQKEQEAALRAENERKEAETRTQLGAEAPAVRTPPLPRPAPKRSADAPTAPQKEGSGKPRLSDEEFKEQVSIRRIEALGAAPDGSTPEHFIVKKDDRTGGRKCWDGSEPKLVKIVEADSVNWGHARWSCPKKPRLPPDVAPIK